MQLQTKIDLICFYPSESTQHIIIHNQEICTSCKEKQCLTICPTRVFKWDCLNDSPILVQYKQCIECGACRLACRFNNIWFEYPPGGNGVVFQEG